MSDIQRKVSIPVSILVAIALVTSIFEPCVSATGQTISNSANVADALKAMGANSGLNTPKVTLVSSDANSAAYRVGDTFVNLTYDSAHTHAAMEIKNTTWPKAVVMTFDITSANGRYTTKAYSGGDLITTTMTGYDPLEPAPATAASSNGNTLPLAGNIMTAAGSSGSLQSVSQSSMLTVNWDGITFNEGGVLGTGEMYWHPVYSSDWLTAARQACSAYTLMSNQLVYLHVDAPSSLAIVTAPALAASAYWSPLCYRPPR